MSKNSMRRISSQEYYRSQRESSETFLNPFLFLFLWKIVRVAITTQSLWRADVGLAAAVVGHRAIFRDTL